ncbi:MAG: glycosyltransferase family 2 protein [Desulfuromonadaceae bacterium]|nr:glycosyltransferase family 2 protein [Desulfuromonadaceae bacterium]
MNNGIKSRTALIIPAHNEAESLPLVLRRIPACIDEVVVVDNGSTDATAEVATRYGARVVQEPVLGYGSACLAGIEALRPLPPEYIAFADGDGSDNHAELGTLLARMQVSKLDLVLAQRVPVKREALSLQQRFGNDLATSLIHLLWGGPYQDLGPMRIIRWEALQQLNMQDRNFGWTIEMQVKALQQGLSIMEVPLTYLPRIAGTSKISRTFSGVIRAGGKILWVIAREAWRDRRYVCQRLLRRRAKSRVMHSADAGAANT